MSRGGVFARKIDQGLYFGRAPARESAGMEGRRQRRVQARKSAGPLRRPAKEISIVRCALRYGDGTLPLNDLRNASSARRSPALRVSGRLSGP